MTAPIRVQHVSIPMPLGGNDEARKFYAETLGLTEIEPPAILGTERFVWFAVGDDGHEVHVYTMDPFVKSQPSQHFCVQVEDGAAFRIKLAEGGFPITETDPITNRPRFFTNDPFGNRVEITEINGDYS